MTDIDKAGEAAIFLEECGISGDATVPVTENDLGGQIEVADLMPIYAELKVKEKMNELIEWISLRRREQREDMVSAKSRNDILTYRIAEAKIRALDDVITKAKEIRDAV